MIGSLDLHVKCWSKRLFPTFQRDYKITELLPVSPSFAGLRFDRPHAGMPADASSARKLMSQQLAHQHDAFFKKVMSEAHSSPGTFLRGPLTA